MNAKELAEKILKNHCTGLDTYEEALSSVESLIDEALRETQNNFSIQTALDSAEENMVRLRRIIQAEQIRKDAEIAEKWNEGFIGGEIAKAIRAQVKE